MKERLRFAAMGEPMSEVQKLRSIAFLNGAHAIDHFVLGIYPTVVIGLQAVYQRPYSELIAISTAMFVAFGVFSLPAGWLAARGRTRSRPEPFAQPEMSPLARPHPTT